MSNQCILIANAGIRLDSGLRKTRLSNSILCPDDFVA